jgi:hypothetical protein
MKNRKQITEEDLLVTESLIAESYGQLKKSVVQAPHRALGAVGGTIRKHPFAAAAVAIAGGIAAYGIVTRIASSRAGASQQKEQSQPDLMKEMLLIFLPLAAPHIVTFIQKYLGNFIQSGKKR